MKEWLVKVKQGRTGASVLASYDHKGQADMAAAGMNQRHRTTDHFVERLDTSKTNWVPTDDLSNDDLYPKW